ncbi:MAG: Flp pilus assembly protein CpaB [Elusimicrobia bacterium]|nr:Flp pilus assembly protein CpaB [Elusimicrobiota bacterium]
MKNKKVLLIAVVMGLFAAILTFMLIRSMKSEYRSGAQMTEVLVARGNIAEGTLLKDVMVDVIKVPAAYKQPKALESMSQILNESYATAVPIMENEQIVSTKLLTPGKDTGLAIIVPENKRAISINVDSASGVAELIKPGNYVDLICTIDEQDKSVTVLQNVLVLAWKQNILGASAAKSQSVGNIADVSAPAEDILPTVTLAVSPYEAQAVALALEKGTLRLVLRGLNDHNIVGVGATTMGVFSK